MPSSLREAETEINKEPTGRLHDTTNNRCPHRRRTSVQGGDHKAGRRTSPKAPPSLPGVKEMVSLRIDRDVLDFFQEDGPGWQDRINAALRKAAGK